MTHFIRKRDGKRYTCDLVPRAWPGFSRRGPSYLLKPVWEGRTHYKTVAAFEREFTRVVQPLPHHPHACRCTAGGRLTVSDWKPSTVFQAQPCPTSCVSACIAMLLNIPVAVVMADHHDAYHNRNRSFREILNSYGAAFTSFDSCDRQSIDESGIYLLTVPSLNIEGGNHEILVEYDDEVCRWAIYDPRQGGEGKRYYSAAPDKEDEQARKLSGFSIDAYLTAKEVARLRAIPMIKARLPENHAEPLNPA